MNTALSTVIAEQPIEQLTAQNTKNTNIETLLNKHKETFFSQAQFNKLKGKDTLAILKSLHAAEGIEKLTIPTGLDVTEKYEHLTSLEYLNNYGKLFTAYCYETETYYLHDAKLIKVHPAMACEVELRTFCTKHNLVMGSVDGELVAVTSNLKTLALLQRITGDLEEENHPIRLFMRMHDLKLIGLIGTSLEQIELLQNSTTTESRDTIELAESFQPLIPLFDDVIACHSSRVKAIICPKTERVIKLEVFQHEKMYVRSVATPEGDSAELMRALKAIDALYQQQRDDGLLKKRSLGFEGKYQNIRVKTSSASLDSGYMIVNLFILHLYGDEIEKPRFHYQLQKSLEDIHTQIKRELTHGKPVILSIHRTMDISVITKLVMIAAIEIEKADGSNFIINSNKLHYAGDLFLSLEEKAIEDMRLLHQLYPSHIFMGTINQRKHIQKLTNLIEDRLSPVIAITYATKEYLPPNLAKFVTVIDK